MKALWNKTTVNLMYWKIAYLKVFLLGYTSFVMALQAGTANIAWASLGNFEKIMIVACALSASATAIMGFLDRTMSRLDAGKPPVETGNTNIFSKQQENG